MSARPRRPVPTDLAALAAGVSEATIRKWASRGKLTRYGGPRRALYDLDELLDLQSGRPQPGRAVAGLSDEPLLDGSPALPDEAAPPDEAAGRG